MRWCRRRFQHRMRSGESLPVVPMNPRLSLRKSSLALVLLLSGHGLLWPTLANAAAADATSAQSIVVNECVQAHTSGQELRQDGHLLESRAKFLQCSQEQCPTLVRAECLGIIDELRSQIPSVVFRVTVDGEPRPNIAVSVDGKELFPEIPTRALEIDPGIHRFSFRYGELAPIEREVAITEGERLVQVPAAFTSPKASPDKGAKTEPKRNTAASRSIPIPVYVLAGVGALGLGSFVGFGLATRSKEGSLRSSCSPNCAQSEIDALENRALTADVSLGIGLLAIAAATTYYFLRPSERVEISATIAPRGGVQSQLRVNF